MVLKVPDILRKVRALPSTRKVILRRSKHEMKTVVLPL
jgi:hypothetical protein